MALAQGNQGTAMTSEPVSQRVPSSGDTSGAVALNSAQGANKFAHVRPEAGYQASQARLTSSLATKSTCQARFTHNLYSAE